MRKAASQVHVLQPIADLKINLIFGLIKLLTVLNYIPYSNDCKGRESSPFWINLCITICQVSGLNLAEKPTLRMINKIRQLYIYVQ